MPLSADWSAEDQSLVDEINAWMTKNFLKLNTDKTDLLLIGPPKCTSHLCIGKTDIAGS